MEPHAADGLFEIKSELGQGAFGNVFLATKRDLKQDVALKIANDLTNDPQIKREAQVLRDLADCHGVPQLLWEGNHEGNAAFAMSLLGKTVYTLVRQSSGLHLGALMKTTITLLKTLEQMHDRGYIHLDVKPDNVLRSLSGLKLFLVDFGFALKFEAQEGRFKAEESVAYRGNPNFSSTRMLSGLQPSRRDDLESLAYVLSYIHLRTLPWKECENSSNWKAGVVRMREGLSGETLFSRLPQEFASFYAYVSQLGFEERPNYRMLRNQFRDAAKRCKVKLVLSEIWVRDKYHRRGSDTLQCDFQPPDEACSRRLSVSPVSREISLETKDIATTDDIPTPKTLKLPTLPSRLRRKKTYV